MARRVLVGETNQRGVIGKVVLRTQKNETRGTNLKSSMGSSAAGGQRYQHLHPNSEIANGY